MTTLICPAKLNLFLKILGKDGLYHKIETVMMRADKLNDFIRIDESEAFEFECPALQNGNSVVKAVELLENYSGKKFKYKVRLEKNIPPQSGLGGASSDAAAVLLYLNEKEDLKISHGDLMAMAAQIGMDVPFFVSGARLALATHYGETIQALPDLPEDFDYEIHFSGIAVSTKEAYVEFDAHGKTSNAHSGDILDAINKSDSEEIIKNLHNDFESIFRLPSISPNISSERALLSGSGGAYGVFRVKNKNK